MSKLTEQIERMMTTKIVEPKATDKDFVSWGVTQLNLGTYGRTHGGIAKGTIVRVIGRSSSGKTFVCRTILAEAAINPSFDKYELIYDDVERGALMDTLKFFGQTLVDRLVAPAYTNKGNPVYSDTIGDFYTRIIKRLEAGKQFIWVLDSFDSLNPIAQTKMGDGKAKIASQETRKLLNLISATGSILIPIFHSKVDMGSMFGGEITTGGRAPEYYSTLDVWLTKFKTLRRIYKGKKYPIGTIIQAHIRKNRLSGLERKVYFPFHPDYGIDDIGANVDFLVTSGHWKKSKSIISATEFDTVELNRTALIHRIEEYGLQRELQVLTGKVWHEIEAACITPRQKRYE
jgi:recombination protein RecA